MNSQPHGGRRSGAGRKKMYGEAMAMITFRVPVSAKETVRTMVRNYLATLTTERKPHEPEEGC